MRKRSRIGFAILLVAGIGGIGWLMVRPSEPVYQGKALSEWLRYYDVGSEPAMRKDVDEAVQQMGTNAIPTLLRRMRLKNSAMRERWFALARKQHVIKVANVSVWSRRMEGVLGFYALGVKGRDAVPELIEMYEEDTSEFRSTIGAVIGRIGGVGSEARKALPALIRGVSDTNLDKCMFSVFALEQIHADPQLMVPALINCLTNRNGSIRSLVAATLGRMGPEARPAIPALVGLLTDGSPEVRKAAGIALKQIEPKAAAKAGGGGE
ncbi:MAG: repeat-containing protein [Pedosphaera sp.]|nr:repeat-containing protein [Pedosphaera sp.]